ncbi:transglutaminase-like domain-containing protein [Micromonospora sp. WMMD998]|uniref:transglutaminase-like domain-containing protein n=1 Tax=Micromonospora sp. WMMD998 TaxID=3016092 RepID=UPI002499F09F|nr:transglutaminase-like domain-containing protein [Micromonospora sp. WMMD998]WFE37842.1 transglutaminase-like domain-containing protein [Micromonospora sp. WMMD998]
MSVSTTLTHAPLLTATEFIDHESEVVRDFVARHLPDAPEATPTERAVALYYAVRDGIHYEVYGADLSRHGLRASSTITRGTGFCVHKSIVYAAALRAVGIPSRIYYGDVRNHLASPQLEELMGGNIFTFHSLTTVYLEGRWVRATPVFNRMLCRLYRIKPLEFDGRTDSMYHPYDDEGRRHMEFLREHGEFDDVPYDMVVGGIRSAHPKLFASRYATARGSLVADATVRGGA